MKNDSRVILRCGPNGIQSPIIDVQTTKDEEAICWDLLEQSRELEWDQGWDNNFSLDKHDLIR